MARFLCNTCGGIYQHPQDDGAPYFHACPPLSEPEYAALPGAEKLTLKVGGPRPLARDEGLRIAADGRSLGVKSEGKGVTQQ